MRLITQPQQTKNLGGGYRGRNKRKRQKNRESRSYESNRHDGHQEHPTARAREPPRMDSILRRGNFQMEAYYAAQGMHDWRWNESNDLVPCRNDQEKKEERQRWLETSKSILPASFRIGKDVPVAVRDRLEEELNTILKDGKEKREGNQSTSTDEHVVTQLQFLPHGYQLQVDKVTIRKTPRLTPLHEWLKQQSQAGFITRQETVSMVPPVVLRPRPNDSVIDMCAAPGSKTSQLLEDLGGADGCLVANDNNVQRAHMLMNQLRRVMHMNPNVLVTCCDGQIFPAVTQFDRVLCDVPCSGDGTARKNLGIWKTWSHQGALALHALQLTIAWRGLEQLLKVGGYMCYSTCSSNPVENEAVVAELLRRGKGALELVKFELEGFKIRPGWQKWKVFCDEKSRREKRNIANKNKPKMLAKRAEFSKEGTAEPNDNHEKDNTETTLPSVAHAASFASKAGANPDIEKEKEQSPKVFAPESLEESHLIEMVSSTGLQLFEKFDDVPENMKTRARATCFPPTTEETSAFHLDRCARCLPHDNNTGGFFVALFRKVGPLSRIEKRSVETKSSVDEPDAKKLRTDASGKLETGQGSQQPTEPQSVRLSRTKGNYVRDGNGECVAGLGRDDFVQVDDKVLKPILEYFGLDEGGFKKDQLMTRAAGDAKVIHLISRPVKRLIDVGLQKKVTVISSGLKAFSWRAMGEENVYRICQEAAPHLVSFITKRKVTVALPDFRMCIADGRLKEISDFSPEFAAKVRQLSTGSFVVVLDGLEGGTKEQFVTTLWRCRSDRVDKLVSDVDQKAIRTKLDGALASQ